MKLLFTACLIFSSFSLISCSEKEDDQATNIAEDNKVLTGSVVEFDATLQIIAFKKEPNIKVVIGESLEVHRPMQGKLGNITVANIDEANNTVFADITPNTFSSPNPDIQPKDTIYRVKN